MWRLKKSLMKLYLRGNEMQFTSARIKQTLMASLIQEPCWRNWKIMDLCLLSLLIMMCQCWQEKHGKCGRTFRNRLPYWGIYPQWNKIPSSKSWLRLSLIVTKLSGVVWGKLPTLMKRWRKAMFNRGGAQSKWGNLKREENWFQKSDTSLVSKVSLTTKFLRDLAWASSSYIRLLRVIRSQRRNYSRATIREFALLNFTIEQSKKSKSILTGQSQQSLLRSCKPCFLKNANWEWVPPHCKGT